MGLEIITRECGVGAETGVNMVQIFIKEGLKKALELQS